MSNRLEKDLVFRILRLAADEQPIPAEGHFVDDEELLSCWSLGLLSEQEHRRILDHLAQCPACRRQLAELLRTGVIELQEQSAAADASAGPLAGSESEVTADDVSAGPLAGEGAGASPAASPKSRQSRWYRRPELRMVLAASVLVAIGGLLAALYGPQFRSELASAKRLLAAGHPEQAMKEAERVLGAAANPDVQADAKAILAEAGYRAARSELASRDFKQVLEIESRVQRRAGPSPGLLNLRLQAERGIPAESALAEAGSLLGYGYEPNGSSFEKSLPTFDGTVERIGREYREAIAKYPEDPTLLVNRGQFLLTTRQFDEAKKSFTDALRLDPRSALAHLGLGLVAYETQKYEDSLGQFQAALEIDPDLTAAQINAAIALEKLGRPAEAKQSWQKALQRTTDEKVRRQIERHLSEGQQSKRR